MTTERLKEIQKGTAYPESVSVMQALFQVWIECDQANSLKVSKLIKALKDIRDFDEDLEDEWEDPGYRATDAIVEYYATKR